MTQDEFKKFIETQKWIFAKTYAEKAPHEYCLKKNCESIELFNDAVVFIRENGVKEKFFKSRFIYFYIDGYKYWTMGAPIDITILINRTNDMTRYG
jgi:hypothetical protein